MAERAQVLDADPPAAAATIFGGRLALAEQYCEILATDGITHGLMGPREIPRLWDRHVLNCAVIQELIDPENSVVDIGSGAGLPGIPLAIARPDLRVTLVEPLLRRATFLTRAVEILGLEVNVVRGRAEDVSVLRTVDPADVVTSRALAPLERLAKWSAPLIRDGGRLVAIKGSSAPEEIDRDGASARRNGIDALRVEQCGTAYLDPATTVIVGVRSGGERPRGRKQKSPTRPRPQ
ncbi:MAG: 16S rRNA (guanine(527)-N(7))-methyltransferase RsmG [Gordonia sp. (in: high G+C Gram-positive bacteria)]